MDRNGLPNILLSIIRVIGKIIGKILMVVFGLVATVVGLVWGFIEGLLGKGESNSESEEGQCTESGINDGPSEIPEPRERGLGKEPMENQPDVAASKADWRRFVLVAIGLAVIAVIALIALPMRSNTKSSAGDSAAESVSAVESTAKDEVTRKALEKTLAFTNVKHVFDFVEDEKNHVVHPYLSLTASVWNKSDSMVADRDLPKIVYGDESARFKMVDYPSGSLGPSESCAVAIEVVFDKDTKPYTFGVEQSNGVVCKGLDSIANDLTEEYSSALKNLPAEQEKVDERVRKEEQEAKKQSLEKQQSGNESIEVLEEQAPKPHIVYTDVDFTAEREGNASRSTIYVVVRMTPRCDAECRYEDQVIIYCQVGDRDPYDMHPIPEDESRLNGSYNDAALKCATRFEAEEGTPVRFWIEDAKSGSTYEGLDGLAESLANATQEAINTSVAPVETYNVDDRICYVTETGHSFHLSKGCPRLSRSKYLYETTVGEARAEGYDPCDSCC